MAGWLRARLCALLALSLGLFCALLSLDALEELRQGGGQGTLILSRTVDESSYQEMTESEAETDRPLDFALWGQLEGQWIEAPELERSISTAVLPVWGDIRLVLPLAGGLGEKDRNGCLIDAHTARSLFGSEAAQGAVLRWQDTELTVRGVFAEPKGTLLLRPREDMALDRVSVSGGERSTFALRHGLSVQASVSGSVLAETARLFCGLPLLMLLSMLCAGAAGLARRSYGYPVRTAVYAAAAFGLGTASALVLLALFPTALLPSRWSDFDQWRTGISSGLEAAGGWLSAAWYRPDRRALRLLARSGLGAVAAQCLLLGGRCLGVQKRGP